MKTYYNVFVTVPDKNIASLILSSVLSSRTAACVSIVGNMRSHYWWDGKIVHSREMLLIMKTDATRLSGLEQMVKKLHPYEVPEFIAVKISKGSKSYLEWINATLEGK
jgi:periplasmic divalent cation tolerance protein